MITPMPHQDAFGKLWANKKRVLNLDDCGTGKTLSCIFAVKKYWPEARVLVLAPLTILHPAWGGDLALGWPEATVAYAEGSKDKKLKALTSGAQWVITNHDTIKLIDQGHLGAQFDVIIVDEADAFRNKQTDRTEALINTASQIEKAVLMTGTPTPRSVTDIWALAFTIDWGERLGRNFFNFRKEVCNGFVIYGAPPGAMNWVDKPEAVAKVTASLADITTRVSLEDVQQLPPTTYRTVSVDMPKKLRDQYEHMLKTSILELESGTVTAIHAGSLASKLLQLMTGAVYDGDHLIHEVHSSRAELCVELATQTDHAIVAFNWRHQRDGLLAEAKRRKLKYAYIDGTVSGSKRPEIVAKFRDKQLDILFAHPQSAGHGLTLVEANRTVWASPTYRVDWFEQFNHRIVRTGQKRKTEIIMVAAKDSLEEKVYEMMMNKRFNMLDLLSSFLRTSKAA